MYSLILFFINILSNYHSASGGKAEDDEGEGEEEGEEGNSGDGGNREEVNEGEEEDSLLGKRKANIEPEEIDIDDV